jgi:hypothetical protein
LVGIRHFRNTGDCDLSRQFVSACGPPSTASLCSAYGPNVLPSQARSLYQLHAWLEVRSSWSQAFDGAGSGSSFPLAESLTPVFYVQYREAVELKLDRLKGAGTRPGGRT